jgi:MFS family permease
MSSTAKPSYIPLSVQRHNLLFVILDGVAVGLMSAGAAFVSVYVIRLGASPLWVSLLSSMPSTIGLVMTIPWSQFAERQRRQQRVWAWSRAAVHIVYPVIALVPLLLQGPLAAKAIVLIWSLTAFPSSLSGIVFTLVMGHAVPPERRAFLMSRRWTLMGIAKLIALPVVSQLIDRMPLPRGYQLVYLANVVIAGAAFYCATQIQIQERKPSRRPTKRPPLVPSLQKGIAEFVQEKPFLVFVSGRAMLQLGLTLVSAIIPIYWINHLQSSDAWVGHFNTALTAATLVSYLPWVRIKRKFGTRWTLIPSVLGTALYPALLALARSPAAVLPAIAFNGLAGGGLNLAFFDALLDTCPPDKEARFVAINMTVINLTGVIGPPIGAALLKVVNIRWILVLGSCVALLGVAVFTFVGTGQRPIRIGLPFRKAKP